jgi:2-oxoglutarate/2-oxoacid ferredoxin oxidoreductase subunit alpha
MVQLREKKVEGIADFIPDQEMEVGPTTGKVLVLGWGGTQGAIKSAVIKARAEGYEVSHAHLRYIKPFPKNLGALLYGFEKVIIPELNSGQLVKVIRDKYMIPAIAYNKVQGLPFSAEELYTAIKNVIQ